MMEQPKDSTRTKMLKEAAVDEDMGPIKRIIKKGAVKGSELLDRMGMTQEDKYKGKKPEDMEKKAEGGGVKAYKKGGKIDGCAQRGKTKGRMV
jgi:hypothetical protein